MGMIFDGPKLDFGSPAGLSFYFVILFVERDFGLVTQLSADAELGHHHTFLWKYHPCASLVLPRLCGCQLRLQSSREWGGVRMGDT